VKPDNVEGEGSVKATGAADDNEDPLSKSSGAHPIGVGVGAAGGGAAGAAVGSAAGPAGAAVGGVVGAVAGGLAGKGVAELVNPTVDGDEDEPR
jgi:phage tail tape-measure protein